MSLSPVRESADFFDPFLYLCSQGHIQFLIGGYISLSGNLPGFRCQPPPVHPACGHQTNVPGTSQGTLVLLLPAYSKQICWGTAVCDSPSPVQHCSPLSSAHELCSSSCRGDIPQSTKVISFMFMPFLPGWQHPSSSDPSGSHTP